jgi:hypothetical protein
MMLAMNTVWRALFAGRVVITWLAATPLVLLAGIIGASQVQAAGSGGNYVGAALGVVVLAAGPSAALAGGALSGQLHLGPTAVATQAGIFALAAAAVAIFGGLLMNAGF